MVGSNRLIVKVISSCSLEMNFGETNVAGVRVSQYIHGHISLPALSLIAWKEGKGEPLSLAAQ